MSLDPTQNRLEFLLRHVDDEPTIADYRSLAEVIKGIAQTAVNFAVIGEVDGATKLLETLVKRGIDPFDYCETCYPYLKPCMYFAWEATSSWPLWIPSGQRTEEKLLEMEDRGRQVWLERFSEEWDVTEETARKALDMAYNGLQAELPDWDGTLAGQAVVADKMSQEGEFSYSASPNGPMSVKYSKIAMWWRQGIFPYPYVQLYRTAGLMIALDIYTRLNQGTEARELFDKICGRIEAYEMIEQLVCSRLVWSKVIISPHLPMLEMLNIHPAKVRPAISRAVQMAEKRLVTGPRRRYMNQGLENLVHTISKNTFENCPYGDLDVYRPSDLPRSRPEKPSGLLRPGCSAADIAALEKRLEVPLPDDYKEFLSVTNGLEAIWNGQNALHYLAKAEDVDWHDLDFLEGNEIPLLRDAEPQPHAGNMLSWPTPETLRCICLSGDLDQQEANGHLFIIGPDIVQPAKDYFFSTYQERNESQRSELDNLVQETYGSMDVFKDLEYVLMCWTPWDLRFYPSRGVRDFLEQMAEASLQKNRHWLYVFEPRYRRLAKDDE
ncbi:hypothetical protein FPOAC2_06152 [Fusarium poae]|jgi:hypothetical protein|uniref:Knr4/Smi1-like domain-containing protein n=1 Tax=Fusarium poae TaxID=36050 RepID=A0A1B8AWS9_FUSPO|nr:hypothetical protein FPOAC1_006035 [Fusarium poae]KAG8672749.1 hypothetical protein FPOAC1_006035 [Fusarium poae]OBS24948.1 hypothetical protein FPOA_05484 [Fusarium poae]